MGRLNHKAGLSEQESFGMLDWSRRTVWRVTKGKPMKPLCAWKLNEIAAIM
jgi:hypothetical protein